LQWRRGGRGAAKERKAPVLALKSLRKTKLEKGLGKGRPEATIGTKKDTERARSKKGKRRKGGR